MKTTSLKLVTALFLAVILTIGVNGQENLKTLGAVSMSKTAKKAAKNFSQRFNDATDVKWYRHGEGYVAYFMRDGMRNRVFYDKKGNFELTLSNYDRFGLPNDIFNLVKSKYPGFKINYVTEVKTNGFTAYYVKIENSIYWKTVKVVDEEIETLMTLFKSASDLSK